MTEQEVWELVLANEDSLRVACRKFLPRSMRRDFEELYSSVVYSRAHSIMRTYDASKGASPAVHLLVNVRWYAYKWIMRRASAKAKHASLEDRDRDPTGDDSSISETNAEVYAILDKLDDLDAQLLRWKYVMGFSHAEIASHLNVTLGAVKGLCRNALERAKTHVIEHDHGADTNETDARAC